MASIGDCVDYKFVLAKTPNQTVEDRIERERDEHGKKMEGQENQSITVPSSSSEPILGLLF